MKLSEKERLICGLLADAGELYGLQLVDLSEGALKRGTVYVTLGRMIGKGLLATRRDLEVHDGLPRPRYRLTAKGAKLLAAERAYLRALGALS
jgi:PadR family transcriptional regulator, regulatory protein PadR